VRLDPGRALPEHVHTGSELTMGLRGSYSDEFGRFSIGDVAEMERTRSHRPVAERDEPCVCLVAEEAPAMLRSVFARLLRPLIGL
jgi:putative transcriptional regulator